MKNKKGFTLIELLAIILIIAVLLLIAMPLINNVIGSVRKRTCFLNTKSMEKAALNYAVFEGEKLPESSSINISLNQLRDKKYITPVFDPSDLKTECEGYVKITHENDNYKTEGHLVCPTYCNAEEYEEGEGTEKNDAYYFDGADPNNWVLFGRFNQSSVYGLLWRVVKTDDGGRKLIFEGLENGGDNPLEDGRAMLGATTGVPYDKAGNNKYGPSTINTELQKWLNNVYVIDKDKYVKKTNWRIGGVPFNDPTSLATFTQLEDMDTETEFGYFPGISELSGVGMLSPSDYMLTSSNPGCVSSYELGGAFNPCIYTDTDLNNFLYKDEYHFWTMNPSSDTPNKAWYINNIGHISTTLANSSVISARPVINIDKKLPFLAGSGTLDDPYIIEEYMINIKDAPIITLIGDGSVVVREGDEYLEEGATAYDEQDGDLTEQIEIISNVNVNVPGKYEIEYNVVDSDGNKAPKVIRYVFVSKKENPVIKLLGQNPLILTLNHPYVEAGATAIDPYYGDISDEIVIDGDVNTRQLGVYEIKYNVENLDNNKAITVIRKVIVEAPRPVITINGDNPTNVYVGGTYEELGATAIDEVDGDLTDKIKTTIKRIEVSKSIKSIVSSITVNKNFRYEISYEVTNSFGVTTTVVRKVYILPDDGPKIEFIPNGSNSPKQKHEVQIKVSKTQYDIDSDSLKYLWVSQYWSLPYKSTLEDVIKTKFNNNSTVSRHGVTGLYRLYAIAKDVYGNTTIKSTKYYKIDNSRPQLWINGTNPQRVLVGAPYVEQGATAYDEYYSGTLTSRIQITGNIDINNPGTYNVIYSVSDDAGNVTTRARKVIVYLSKPTIKLKGSKTEKVILGQDYIEPGFTATDEKDGNITNEVVVTGAVDRNQVGIYPITYTVTNSFGETATITREVEVYIPSPEIKINGSNPLNHKVLEPYTDLGATAYDLIDGDLSDRIQTSSNINNKIKGKYEVNYSVINNNGKVTTATRIVNVVAPKPTLTLNNNSFIKLFINDIYEEFGATAIDEIDGDITSNIKIIGTVNPSRVGTYQLKYEVTNSFNETTYKVRTVQVVEPQISITLKGSNPFQMEIFDEFIEPGYIAIHEQLGDITNKIQVSSNLNAKVAGKYKNTYFYKTDYGSTKSVTRNITVHQQEGPFVTFAPSGSLKYNQNFEVKVDISENNGQLDNASFKYLWSTSQSKPTEGSFGVPFTNGQVINTPSGKSGNYYLWVLAKDIYNNTTIKSSNAYLLDNTIPVIKLNGPSIIEIPVDGIYQELGATVIEQHSGLNSEGLIITSNITPGMLGTYTVTYNATDNSGLKAKPITRTVNVIEASLKDAPGEDFVPKFRAEYFIGQDPKNWVEFGNASNNVYDYIPILWRIIKADDEGIKIIYEGPYNSGSKPLVDGKLIDSMFDGTTPTYTNSVAQSHLEQWYENLNEPNKETLTSPIKWCIGGISTPYDIDKFKGEECSTKTDVSTPIGMLNSVDYLLTSSEPCDAYNQTSCGTSNFLKKSYNYLTINSASDQAGYIFGVESSGALRRTAVTQTQGLRPVINLKADVLILGGNGSLENPYKLNTRIPILDETPPLVTFEYGNITEFKKEHEVRVIVTDDISGVDPGSLKYVWTTSTTKPQETEFVNSFVNGELIKTPIDKTGTYYLWVLAKDRKGNQAIPMSEALKLDNKGPVITLKGDNPYILSIGNPYIEPGATAIDNVDGDISDKIIITGIINPSIDGTYEIVYEVSDSLGNKSIINRTVVVEDTIPPTVSFGSNGNTTYAKNRSTTVTVSDAHSGVNASSLKYLWNTSTSQPSEGSFVSSFTNGETINTPADVTGGYYLWILAKDNAGNTTIARSNVFNLDNAGPVISGVTTNVTNRTHDSFTITRSGNAIDAHSGLATNPYIYQRSTDNSTWTNVCTNNTTSCNVTGLNENTTYYYRVCVNDILSNQSCTASKTTKTIVSWTCGQSITDTRDGKSYNTTQIGTQCWFAENLKYTGNGCLSNSYYSSSPYNACLANGSEIHYQWRAAMNGSTTPGAQGICPSGWHLPTDDEWKILEGTVDSTYGVGNSVWNITGWRGSDVGKKLKSTSVGGTDDYGFNGLLAGTRYNDGALRHVGGGGFWWSSSSTDGSYAWRRSVDSSNDNVYRPVNFQAYGFSVRCVWD